MRSVIYAGALTLVASAAVAQSARAPQFDAADVHVSVKSPQMFMRVNPPRNGRYEIKNATMLDLVRTAYGMTSDRVVGGPNWLELDRFDIITKVPDGADADESKATNKRALLGSMLVSGHTFRRGLPLRHLDGGLLSELDHRYTTLSEEQAE